MRSHKRVLRWVAACAAALTALVLAAPASACGEGDPAGDPATSDACAGNPINVITGNKYQREVDMPALPGVLGLELVRYYNSAFSAPTQPNGALGRGWRLSYETELMDRWGKVQVLKADGGRVIFDRDPKNPTGCSTPDPANGTMRIGRQPDGKPDYTWTQPDGRTLHFNAAGKLDRITVATGETVRLLYDSQDVLMRVIDPQGRSLDLVYYDRKAPNQFHGVQFIDTPVGRFAYEYGSSLPKGAGVFDKRQLLANLVRVRLPDHFDPDKTAQASYSRGTTRSTLSRIYLHEDPRSPWLMTGISIESAGADGKPVTERYSTYGYDDTGRAILSTHTGDVDKVTLDNSKAGTTVLTNNRGQKTVYRYTLIADEFRMLEVRGAGCRLCGEPNVRYSYDDAARRLETTKLSDNGEPITTTKAERDKLGRVLRVTKVVYQHGKPGPAQLLERFEYQGSSFAPALVARPSVVPGKELVKRTEYNPAGQPLSVTETGWTPGVGGKPATQIERTTRYRYATINGRSLLTEIDGPLPNGKTNSPADSDITIFEYDHRPAPAAAASAGALAQYEQRDGLLTRVIAPGNLVTEVLERDAALRPTRLRTTDGNLVQEVSMTSNWFGAPLHFELAAGALRRKMDYEYNSFGQLVAVTMPGNLRTTFAIDSVDRGNRTVPPDGSGISEQALQMAAAPTADVGKQPDAAQGIQMRTGVVGSTSEYTVEELFRISDGKGEKEVLARRWLDDFGRLVALQYSGQGVTRATYYGGSERIATLTDAAGIVTQLDYNTRGQLTTLERRGGDGKLAGRIQYKHQGSWLVEVAKYSGTGKEPENRIRFVRNAFGQITQELQASGTTSYAVNHTYDEVGRLTETWLTEHSGTGQSHDLPVVSMRYASDTGLGGQIDSIRAGDGWFGQRIVVSALRWLLPSPAVATAWRLGNGLQAQAQYEALKGQQTRFAWRLRGFNDGVHPYTISSDASGHIDAASQQERGTLAENNSWHLMSEAHAAPAPEPLTSSGTIAVASADTDANKFDAAGRMRSYRSGQGELDLTWDSTGQLVQVSRDGKRVASYAYDGQGRRISKTVDAEPGANRMFIYSDQQLIAEADADGTILKQYIYVGWRPVAWIEPAQTLLQRVKQYLFGPKIVYLHTDHRGAVTAATDGDQRILWESNVDAFGNLDSADNNRPGVDQPLRLAGQYADRETGLYYNLARYYDPRSGNFISPDPAGLESRSLDLYAYANGDPLNYFDPDGWAKVVYYAITSKANGKTALGTNPQGFTNARWAFVISDIKDGVKDNVIYDPTGGFVKSKFATAKGDAYAWNKSDDGAGDPTSLMKQYYGNSLISLSEFTIDNFDDKMARTILAKLGYADEKPLCEQAVLPQISFAAGDAAIDVTDPKANGANKQRILSCGSGSQENLEQRDIAKYEAAAEINETYQINRDCSKDGCPGIAYYCDTTRCFSPQDQIIKGPPKTTEPVYTPSYGRTQFVGTTLLDQLTKSKLTAGDSQQIGLTPEIKQRLLKALSRGKAALDAYNSMSAAGSFALANASWNQLTTDQKNQFINTTGLGEREYTDMKRMTTQPPVNSKGVSLKGDAAQAFATAAILRDATVNSYLMGLFKDFDKFTILSHSLMKKNRDTVISKYPSANAEEIAARTARLHNGSTWQQPFPELISNDPNNYVKKFLGYPGFTEKGDLRSLRCVDKLDGGANEAPGNKGIGGLEMQPLTLSK